MFTWNSEDWKTLVLFGYHSGLDYQHNGFIVTAAIGHTVYGYILMISMNPSKELK